MGGGGGRRRLRRDLRRGVPVAVVLRLLLAVRRPPEIGCLDIVLGHEPGELLVVVLRGALPPELSREHREVEAPPHQLHALRVLRVDELHLLERLRVQEVLDDLESEKLTKLTKFKTK